MISDFKMTSNQLKILLQRQHFLFSYFKALNVGAASRMLILCTLCEKIYVDETGRRFADRFREQLRDLEKKTQMRPKPLARDFILPNYSHHMTICGLSLHHGNTESRKSLARLVQKFIFQLGTLSPHGINERLSFH